MAYLVYDSRVLNRSLGEWARVCRTQAALTSDSETRQYLLKMAADYEAKAALSAPSLSSLFYDQVRGTFRDGFVFQPNVQATMNGERNDDLGYWGCDLSKGNKLTWSDQVYELFGVTTRTPLDREWVVERYGSTSRTTLERVRDHAIRRRLGFILDAEINPEGRRARWMRIFALPIADEHGAVVRLRGAKREL